MNHDSLKSIIWTGWLWDKKCKSCFLTKTQLPVWNDKNSVCCYAGSAIGPSEFFQSTLPYKMVLPLLWHGLGNCIVLLIFHRCNFPFTWQKTLPWSQCPGSLVLTIFPFSLLQRSLRLTCRGSVIRVTIGVGHPEISFSLHLDQLFLSEMVSIFCTNTLLWWRACISGYEDKCLEHS